MYIIRVKVGRFFLKSISLSIMIVFFLCFSAVLLDLEKKKGGVGSDVGSIKMLCLLRSESCNESCSERCLF